MIELTLTPELAAKLGLATEGEEITSERFLTALDAALTNAGGGEEHAQQLATITTERDAAVAKLKEIEEAQTMAEVDAMLAEYEMPEESAAAMRELAKVNRDQAKALLGGMKKKEAKVEGEKAEESKGEGSKVEGKAEEQPKAEEKKTEEPPPVIHDPKGGEAAGASEADRNAAIAEYRKEHPGATFQQAWQFLQRTKPELFKQGEAAA